jgi:hypothetical protein
MKGETEMLKFRSLPYVILLGLLFLVVPQAQSADSVVVTPPSIAADYVGSVTVSANVGIGDEVILSLILDFNGNGSIDGTDGPLSVFVFEDGPQTLPHPDRVLDWGQTEDGHIDAVIPMFAPPHIAGDFILQVKDSGSAATATWSVTPPVSWNQSVTGSVAKGGANQPAVVMGLVFLEDSEIEIGTATDQNGDFQLYLPSPGDYGVAAFFPGLLSDLESGSGYFVTLFAGQTVALPFDLQLFDGDYTVSGQVVYADSPETGVPFLRLFMDSDSDNGADFMSLVITDPNGNFALPAKAATVEIWPDMQNQRGLVVAATEATIIDQNVTGLEIPAWQIEGVISGTVINQDPAQPLHIGLEIFADTPQNEWIEIGDVSTNLNGDYWIGVVPGSWSVNPEQDILALFDYLVLPPTRRNVTVSQGQIVENVDFIIAAADTFLNVQVRDGTASGPPVEEVGIVVSDSVSWEFVAYQETDQSGDARIGLEPGIYWVDVSNDTIRDRGYAQPDQQEVTLAQGAEETITFALQVGNATATVRVWDTLDNPVPNVHVSVNRVEGLDYFWAGGGETDAQGQISVPIMAGDYAASIDSYMGSPDGFVRGMVPFTANVGENRVIDLYLFPEEATLNLHARDKWGFGMPVEFVILDDTRHIEITRAGTGFSGDVTVDVPAMALQVLVDPDSIPLGFQEPDPQAVIPGPGEIHNLTFILEPLEYRLSGDLNDDHIVDHLDLYIFMSQWGQTW